MKSSNYNWVLTSSITELGQSIVTTSETTILTLGKKTCSEYSIGRTTFMEKKKKKNLNIEHVFHYIHFQEGIIMVIIISGRQHGLYDETLHIHSFSFRVQMLTITQILARHPNGFESFLKFDINSGFRSFLILLC